MRQPKVSVIIPVYNAERYLPQTLDSVLAQTWKDFEIVLINDGSEDNSANLLEEYQKRHSNIIVYHQKNRGQAAASNLGLSLSNGEYIKFLDADDLINPEHIALQMLRLNGSQNCIASCEWGRFYDDNPGKARFIPENVWKDLPSMEWIKTALRQKTDMMGACIWLIPRKIIDLSGGWNESLSLNNDFEFSIRILLNSSSVKFTAGARIYYRSDVSGSLSSSKSRSAYISALASANLGCGYLLDKESSDEMKLLCANRYQEWAYRIYPDYPDVIKQIESKIEELGGSNRKMDGGTLFKILRDVLGWKTAKKIQTFAYNIGYTPNKRN